MQVSPLTKYKNSVFQIFTVSAIYSHSLPYSLQGDVLSSGTGFLIDSKRGLICTNAHVVANAISIVAHSSCCPNVDLRMRLISICREKDLAVCQLVRDDLEMLMKNEVHELEFGNSLLLSEMDEVASVGYPLSQNSIKFTQGNISGFQNGLEFEDSVIATEEDNCTFIQTTAPINEGNSGGPLLDVNGKVIGVCSAGIQDRQSTGYAIPSIVVLSVLPELLKPVENDEHAPYFDEVESSIIIPRGGNEMCFTDGKCIKTPHVVVCPKMGIKWCPSNQKLLSRYDEDYTGIYVSSVYDYSVFKSSLTNGDIIAGIEIDTHYGILQGVVDNYGYVNCTIEGFNYKIRKLSIRDVIDYCVIGENIRLWILRDTRKFYVQTQFECIPLTYEMKNCGAKFFSYPHFVKPEYGILAGMCVVPITLELALEVPELSYYVKGKCRNKTYLYLSKIFPGTEASRVKSLREGDIISKVCGEKVNNLQHALDIVKFYPEVWIENTKSDILFLSKEQANEDTEMVNNNFIV